MSVHLINTKVYHYHVEDSFVRTLFLVKTGQKQSKTFKVIDSVNGIGYCDCEDKVQQQQQQVCCHLMAVWLGIHWNILEERVVSVEEFSLILSL